MDAEAEFSRIAGKVGQSGVFEITPRQLSRLVGAERRGTRIVAEIRSRLARHNLQTDPDFASALADERVRIVPDEGHRPPHLAHLEDARRRLVAGEMPLQTSVRTLLEWFGAERRGPQNAELIRATLSGFDLETRPDFESVHVDAVVALVRTEASPATPPPMTGAPPPSEPQTPVTTATSAQQSAMGSTFRIGTLVEANRAVISTSPQTRLRDAMSTMLCHRISHLPVMAGARSVKGIVRWKDVGRFLLLDSAADLDKPVECAMVPAKEVSIDQPFLDAIGDIIAHGCVLVRDNENRICGVLTTDDLGRQLQHLAAPFVTLGEIERGLRALVDQGEFTVDELKSMVRDPAGPRDVSSVADLSLGELQRLLDHDDAWRRIELPLARRAFMDRLSAVRRVRNEVMHFEPDSPTQRDRHELQMFLSLMYEIRRHLSE